MGNLVSLDCKLVSPPFDFTLGLHQFVLNDFDILIFQILWVNRSKPSQIICLVVHITKYHVYHRKARIYIFLRGRRTSATYLDYIS